MTVTRRRFFKTTGALGATAATGTLINARRTPRARGMPATLDNKDLQPLPSMAALAAAKPLPPLAIIALNRMGYGPRPGDVEAFEALPGATPQAKLQAYVDQQLAPDTIDDSACDARIAAAQLKIKYDTVHEIRPLQTLDKSSAELWALRGMNFSETSRPLYEVWVATWLRALYSKRQLKEVLVDFWHSHFNVNGLAESAISCTFPVYDRLMRTHCLGNFRTLLEEVGKSTAMMYYLDNVSNKASGGEGGNENYARELFELHTISARNYFKFYQDRSQIGTTQYNGNTYVAGYIDEDVYEAAACLTGWTIDTATGTFKYEGTWHWTGPKTVLSTTIPRNQAPMEDGQDVFDLLARHPGTARHLCTKLCRRLIADSPPSSVIDAAVQVWMANLDAPDQIRQVVRTILLSDAFQTTWGQKLKRPAEAVAAYLRATNAEAPNDIIDPNDANKGGYWINFYYRMREAGHSFFDWRTPDGYPDNISYWASTNGMLRRWNMPYIIIQWWGGNMQIDLIAQTDLSGSCTQIVDFWIGRLCGYSIDPAVRQELIAFMAQGGDPNQPPRPTAKAPDWNDPNAINDRLNSMVQLLATSPDFHAR